MPHKIALSGYRGFLGQHLIYAAAQRGFECVCLKSNLLDSTSLTQEITNADFQSVIHLAALNPSQANPLDYYHTNVIGTENLLQAISQKQSKPTRILLCSSAHIYQASQTPLTEHSPTKPLSHYALSKYAMEQRTHAYPTLPISIIRLFNTIGTGQKEGFLIPKLIRAFKDKLQTLSLGNISVYRDFSDVRWVVDRLLDLSVQDCPKILNLCSNNAHSIAQIIELLTHISQHSCRIIQESQLMRQEPAFMQGDNTLLLSLSPTPPTPLQDTLQWIYENS